MTKTERVEKIAKEMVTRALTMRRRRHEFTSGDFRSQRIKESLDRAYSAAFRKAVIPALELLQAIKSKYPEVKNSSVYFEIHGMVNRQMGHLDAALCAYNKAINMHPTNIMYYVDRASVKKEMNDMKAAEVDFAVSRELEKEIEKRYQRSLKVQRVVSVIEK